MLLKNTNSLYELVNNLSYYSYLTLFIQYKLDPATLREATLVRIEKVFAAVMPRPAFNNPVTFTAGRLDIDGHVHGQRWTV